MNLTACSLLLFSLLNFSSGQTIAPSALHSYEQTSVSDELTKANWQQHPKIKAVRAVVQAVKTGLGRKSFKVRTREFEYCEPYEDSSRTVAIDAGGRVRYYEKQAGSDDSALKLEHYYDEAGHLRFVFITGGAANGSELEHRIYLDENGKRIWEEQKYTKGPGYTFPEIWPDEELQRKDVTAAFNAKSPCTEKKTKAGSKVQGPRSKVKN
jgi:hypothetical protein